MKGRFGTSAWLAIAVFAAALGGGFDAAPQAFAQDAERERYIDENQGRFEDWGKKIDAFKDKAADAGSDASSKAKEELDEAWIEVKDGWATLKSAGKEGWEEAKRMLEASWHKLERVWNDVQR